MSEEKKKKKGYISRIWDDVFKFVSGKEGKGPLQEKKKREEEVQKEIDESMAPVDNVSPRLVRVKKQSLRRRGIA